MTREEAEALLERNPKVRDLMELWNMDYIQKNGQIFLYAYASNEEDAKVNWLPVYWVSRGFSRPGQTR